MDVFQGWYKDGIDHYRLLSAFFLSDEYLMVEKNIVITLLDDNMEHMLRSCGNLSNFNWNVIFWAKSIQEYLDEYNADGIIFTLVGCYILIGMVNNKQLKLFVIVVEVLFTIVLVLYKIFKAHNRFIVHQTIHFLSILCQHKTSEAISQHVQ